MTKETETIELNTVNDEIEEAKKPFYKKKRIIGIGTLSLIAIITGLNYYNHAMTYVSTDNAYIEGHHIQIASKASGTVTHVYVDDNENVKQGQLIAELDDRDYKAKYDQAEAKLESAIEKQKSAGVNVDFTAITSKSAYDMANSGVGEAKASIKMSDKQILQAKANLAQVNADIESAKAEFKLADINYTRYSILFKKGVVSKQDFDKATTSYQTQDAKLTSAIKKAEGASSAVQSAYANKEAANKSLELSLGKLRGSSTFNEQVSMSSSQSRAAIAEIKQLQAAARQAKLDLNYTKIYAPKAGIITSKSIEEGAYIQIGQPLLSIVPEDRWVLANFKETQLTKMKVGQKVFIKTDAYPDKTFKGHVNSIQASTGARTSLFPPENAVGSFVKVVQRVPVKIVFDEKINSNFAIVPGMSVIPEVKIK